MHKIIICPQLVRAASFGKEMLETRKKIKVEVVEEEHGAKTISDKHVGRTNVYFILALVRPRREPSGAKRQMQNCQISAGSILQSISARR